VSVAPVVIAHRGASGYLPEHTLPAKALAHGMGADFLEQDVVASRDGKLIVFHDLHLDQLTDVAERFPGRTRSDGKSYCIDFSLAEMQTLRVTERRSKDGTAARYPGRFPAGSGNFRIHTLEEELEFIRGLNRSTSRQVGVYVEIKDPDWHRQHDMPLGDSVLRTLGDFGYRTQGDEYFVQCFSASELRRVRAMHGAEVPLIQLLEEGADVSSAGLSAIAEYSVGIGPAIGLAWPDRGLVRRAHELGLLVHPHTFRADALPPQFTTFAELVSTFIDDLGVDGLFTDFPDLVLQQRGRRA